MSETECPDMESHRVSTTLDDQVTNNYYNLQIEETASHMNLSSNPGQEINWDREVELRTRSSIIFSPGGDEGFVFTGTSNAESPSFLTPREISDTFLDNRVTNGNYPPDSLQDEMFHSVGTAGCSPRSAGCLTDRAASPSVASITSSAASVTGRRYLEWDYGSDLGPNYLDQGNPPSQVQAAMSLSALEKLAIGNYSEYLQEQSGSNNRDRYLVRPDLPQADGEEMQHIRLANFADSLMRQRQIREQQEQLKKPGKLYSGHRQTKGECRENSTEEEPAALDVKFPKMVSSSSLTDYQQKTNCGVNEICPISPQFSPLSQRQLERIVGPVSSSSSAGTVVAAVSSPPSMFVQISTSPTSLPHHMQDIVVRSQLSSLSSLSGERIEEDIQVITHNEREGSLEVVGGAGSSSSRLSFSHSVETVKDLDKLDVRSSVSRNKGLRKSISLSQREFRCSSTDKDVTLSSNGSDKLWNNGDIPGTPLEAWIDYSQSSGGRKYEQVDTSLQLSGEPVRPIASSHELNSVLSSSDDDGGGESGISVQSDANKGYIADSSTMESVRMVDQATSFEYIPGESYTLQENSSSYEYLPGHLIERHRPPTVLTGNLDESLEATNGIHQQVEAQTSGALQPVELQPSRVQDLDVPQNSDSQQPFVPSNSGIQQSFRHQNSDIQQPFVPLNSGIQHPFVSQNSGIQQPFVPSNCGIQQAFVHQNIGILHTIVSQNSGIQQPLASKNRAIQEPFVPHSSGIQQPFAPSKNQIDKPSKLKENNLDKLSTDLQEKLKELLVANICQTKGFFKKLKGYLDFISTPSLSVEDCQVKQEIAKRIMSLLTKEESRLESRSLLSSNSSNQTSSIDIPSGKVSKSVSRETSKSVSRETDKEASLSLNFSFIESEILKKSSQNTNTTKHLINGSKLSTGTDMESEESTRRLQSNGEFRKTAGFDPQEIHSDLSSQLTLKSIDLDKNCRNGSWREDLTRSELLKSKVVDIKEENNLDDVQLLHKKRVKHLKKLRKEIKELEKLDLLVEKSKTSKSTSAGSLTDPSTTLPSSVDDTNKDHRSRTSKREHVTRKNQETSISDASTLFKLSKLNKMVTVGVQSDLTLSKGVRENKNRLSPGAEYMKHFSQMYPSLDTSEMDSLVNKENYRPLIQSQMTNKQDCATLTRGLSELTSQTDVVRKSPRRRRTVDNKRPTSVVNQNSSIPNAMVKVGLQSDFILSKGVTEKNNRLARGSGSDRTKFSQIYPRLDTIENESFDDKEHIKTLTNSQMIVKQDFGTQNNNSSELDSQTSVACKSPRKIRTVRNKLPASEMKLKPVAYYFCLGSLQPIRIGSRVLKESNNDNPFMCRSNRNILTNYMASLRPESCTPTNQQIIPTKADIMRRDLYKLSLQEALSLKRPDFVANCKARVAALKKSQKTRRLHDERRAVWLSEVAAQSPRSRRLARPAFTPIPISRVFSHREMVQSTREKYVGLPEVVNKKYDIKKSTKYKTNRLMAQIYSNHLQRKVIRGQVSLTHHDDVIG